MKKSEVRMALKKIRAMNLFPTGETNWFMVRNKVLEMIEKELELNKPKVKIC